MRYALFLAGAVAWAGQGINLSTVRTQNASFTAMAHTAVVCEFELSGWSSVTGNDGMAELNAAGIAIDYSNSTTLRIASNWITGVVSASNLTIPLGSFSNSYLYGRIQYDNAGAIGPPKVFYAEAYDINGVEQFSGNITYTADTGTSAPGVYAGQNGNATVQRVHFMRCGANLVPIGSRSPATADIGPLNANTWAFQWKFDGSLADATGNGWTAVMSDSSTPSVACGSTATSYCATQYQNAIPRITTSSVTWRAGTRQSPSGATSFSQADASPNISNYFWQILSGPSFPVWSSHAASAPNLDGLIAGDYAVQLTVTDSTPATATTTQHIGVVATDANDVVINPAGLPTAAQTNVLLGPLQKWQTPLAAYPLFDQLHALQWTLRSGPTGDFQTPLNGSSGYQAGTNFFDYVQAGTVSLTQQNGTPQSHLITGVGTSWLTTACATGGTIEQAGITTWINPGNHTSDTFTVAPGANKLTIGFDGGSPINVTLTTGARMASDIAADIQTAIGAAVNTTIPSVASGSHTVTPASMAGISIGMVLAFNDGTSFVNATVTGVTGSTFTATFPVMLNQARVTWRTAVPSFNGYLIQITSSTIGAGGSVAISPVSGGGDAYTLLGLATGTYTVANVPQQQQAMTITPFYPTSILAPPNPAFPTGRRQLSVLSCLSDTSMVIEEESGLAWRLPNVTNVQYSLDNASYGLYYNRDNNGQYYDNVFSDYVKAFKGGVASDLTQARNRADRWFRGPDMDMGQEFTTSNDGTTFTGSGRALQEGRLFGLAGLVLRALDGQPNYWTGLEYIIAMDVTRLTTSSLGASTQSYYTDQREMGYALQRVSMCALYDPGSFAATCRAALVSFTNNVIMPSRNTIDSAYPYWPALYYSSASFQGSSSVCLVNGSTSVVGTGTAFSFQPGTYAWFFPNPGSMPANNAAGDPVAYIVTLVDATHIALSSPYAGATACTGTSGTNKGWLVYDTISPPSYVGWGAQPFMEGLMAQDFAWASLATACTSRGVPTSCDNSTSLLLKGYVSDAAQWIVNVGYDVADQGVFQGANYVNCTPPTISMNCYAGTLPSGARVIAQESAGGVSWAYRLSGTTAFKTNADAQFGTAWTDKTGIPDYNPPVGGYVSPPAGNVASAKYYGLMAGIDGQPSYQAVRTCTAFPCLSPLLPASNVTLRATGCLASNSCSGAVSNATKYTMVMTEPNGLTATSICTTPTCTVTANLTQGSQVIVQITYLSAGNAQLAQGDPFVVVVQ